MWNEFVVVTNEEEAAVDKLGKKLSALVCKSNLESPTKAAILSAMLQNFVTIEFTDGDLVAAAERIATMFREVGQEQAQQRH